MTPDDGLLLPRGVRLLHIGPQKTGSTAIQMALLDARDVLARHGVVHAGAWPGRHGGRGAPRPKRAGWALGIAGRPAGSEQPGIEHWTRLVDEVAAAGDRRVVVSNEDFGRATSSQVEQVVAGLGDGRAHVVAVVRRLDRYLPSQWQERVKAGETRAWDDWLRVVLDRDDGNESWERDNVWFAHDTGALIDRWAQAVGSARMTVVVTDDSDRRFLHHAFEGMLGLPGGSLRDVPGDDNRSLSFAETELLRAVNLEFAATFGDDVRHRRAIVKGGIVRRLNEGPRPDAERPLFPDWAAERVRQLSCERVEAIRTSGCRVVGDLSLLTPPDDLAVGPVDTPTVDVGLAAMAVIAGAQGHELHLNRQKRGATLDHGVDDASPTMRHRTMAALRRVIGGRR